MDVHAGCSRSQPLASLFSLPIKDISIHDAYFHLLYDHIDGSVSLVCIFKVNSLLYKVVAGPCLTCSLISSLCCSGKEYSKFSFSAYILS